MAKKTHPDELERDAVVLYRDSEGATLTAIAAELGIRDRDTGGVAQGRGCGDAPP
ncbi:hypothetical protein [Mycobacterium camsae]|uniref:hypothetical protein n=1 Tax=Mycobacterium gordonae TaxID=1778 RepID=UPI00197F183F|nr:hypothetical protein [Mycobacterium gordonae]